MLYSDKILNNFEFKTGRYANFLDYSSEIGWDADAISRYEGGIYKPRFYKIRLIQKLPNGSTYDLTNHIWEKYNNYPSKKEHWAWDPDFKYFCPTQYKGVLIAKVEIEDIFNFNFYYSPTFDKLTNGVKLSFKINHILKNTYSTNGFLSIIKIILDYKINGVDKESISTVVTENTTTIELSLPESDINKKLSYTLTPVLLYTKPITPLEIDRLSFPTQYKDKYSLTGELDIILSGDDYIIERYIKSDSCNLVQEKMIYNEFVLKNKAGNYIDNSLEITTTPHVFLRNGFVSKLAGSISVGTFTTDNLTNKPIVTPTLAVVPSYVLSSFNQQLVEVNSTECVDWIEITLNFNINISSNTIIRVTQPNKGTINYNASAVSTIDIDVVRNIPAQIDIIRPGFYNISYNKTFTAVESLDFAFIAYVSMIVNTELNYFQFTWNTGSQPIPISDIISLDISIQGLELFNTSFSSIASNIYQNPSWGSATTPIGNYTLNSVDVVSGVAPTTAYLNMIPEKTYKQIQGVLFKSTLI